MTSGRQLTLRFHGRVIDHLGLEMYQSPVAAVAELVSNAWDADASEVEVVLPVELDAASEIVIRDDGIGMTFEECQNRFLQVGYNRRGGNPSATSRSGRPLLGRKGIGKFAGFGIARTLEIETISIDTGERTVFKMDLEALRGDPDQYVDTSEQSIEVIEYEGPDDARKANHGTTVFLSDLSLSRRPSAEQFGRSMARRFIILERAEGFVVRVNGDQISAEEDAERVQFDFPDAYSEEERPAACTVNGKWGVEQLSTGETVRWRFVFYHEPIEEEELVGVAIFAHGKLAQRPFLFNLTGGLGGQTGTHYLSGRLEADFVDENAADLISTERQRINWEHEATQPLLDWGQTRVQELLRVWKNRRTAEKVKKLKERLEPYAVRLGKLQAHERKVVEKALQSVARIETLSNLQFAEFATAMLTAWESGRLRDLIDALANADSLDEGQLVSILMEARVVTALHTAEKVRSQVELVEGLRKRIEGRDLENAVRDYIAENPWMLGPEWETFDKERSIDHLVAQAADEAELNSDQDWQGRVDLVLSAGGNLLVVEFMRPGLGVDWDHIDRFTRYVNILREKVEAATGQFKEVRGLLVADKLEKRTGMVDRIRQLRDDNMDVTDWLGLLAGAESQWRDFLELLRDRAPEDERLASLIDEEPARTSEEPGGAV